jgi:hypothetical protein
MGDLPASLITAVAVQVSCQVFKLVYYSIADRRFTIGYLVTAGGMPSAHTAFVTALSVAVGIRNGFESDVFAVAFVFSAIVIYDAYRFRGHVERQGKVLNRVIARYHPSETDRVPEMVGHSLGEIAVGLLLGGGLSAVATLLWP